MTAASFTYKLGSFADAQGQDGIAAPAVATFVLVDRHRSSGVPVPRFGVQSGLCASASGVASPLAAPAPRPSLTHGEEWLIYSCRKALVSPASTVNASLRLLEHVQRAVVG